MSALANPKAPAIERALVQGDLSGLSEEERIAYYRTVCESLGLNPFTRPFGYISFDGKLQLYTKKDCTEQLRKLHNISLRIISREEKDGIYEVLSRASMPDGREDEDVGDVSIQGLKGKDLANARMKAVTKAKRRATLSICGLGFLDESELETVSGAGQRENGAPQLEHQPASYREEIETAVLKTSFRQVVDRLIAALAECGATEPAILAKCGVAERKDLPLEDLIILRGDLAALKAGQVSVEVCFPPPPEATPTEPDKSPPKPRKIFKKTLATLMIWIDKSGKTLGDKEAWCAHAGVDRLEDLPEDTAQSIIHDLAEAWRREQAAQPEREPGSDDEDGGDHE